MSRSIENKHPELARCDVVGLRASEGWLELGNGAEAGLELARIDPALKCHPEVLFMEWRLCRHEGRWDACVELAARFTRLHPHSVRAVIVQADTAHCLGRTAEAYEFLTEKSREFPREWSIWYRLGWYACRLGRDDSAERHLRKALEYGPAEEVEAMFLNEPDFEMLWGRLEA